MYEIQEQSNPYSSWFYLRVGFYFGVYRRSSAVNN